MQCNVKFGYQLSVWSGTEENHGKASLRIGMRLLPIFFGGGEIDIIPNFTHKARLY
jgi:hypothetical protein